MTDLDQKTFEPVTFAGGILDPYRHVCAFVDSRSELHRIFDPFMAEGLMHGERLSLVVGPEERADWVRHIRHAGLDPARLLEQGQVEVRSWWEADGRESHFDMDAMLRLVDELLNDSPSPRIRFVSEMGWAADHSDKLLEFEARANYLMPTHEHIVFCVYDTARFSSDIVIDILRTHPMALIGGRLQVNPFFVPPAEFLAELRSRDRDSFMADANPPGGMAVDVPAGDGIDSSTTYRRQLRDLAVLLAIPAMWVDLDPADITAGLLRVLFGVLRLECGYVRFEDSEGGPALECWRPAGPRMPIALESVLRATPARAQGIVTVPVAAPNGGGTMRVTSISPELPGEAGLVLVGSTRTDFPTEFELHLLRVAVSQATIAINMSRRLANERAAHVAAEAALKRRNAFLAMLAEELRVPLATLAEHAAGAHAFASESDQPAIPTRVVVDDPAGGAVDARQTQVSARLLAAVPRLTQREAEVLGLLAQGLSNREIAAILSLSERTIERHITGLYRKIGVERRTEATAFALRYGLVESGEHET
jgi:DNA-binding CsgD family transcriptional regulator